jgi:hypothetical protein
MTPTPDQIAELKAAGYDVIKRGTGYYSIESPHTHVFNYYEYVSRAWSAAWSHYQTQRNK